MVNVPILTSIRPAILPVAFCAVLLPGPQDRSTPAQLVPTVHPALPESAYLKGSLFQLD